MIKFPLNLKARVELIDRLAAELVSIVVNPAEQRVVSFIVQDKSGQSRVVPLEDVVDADDALVRLRISSETFFTLPVFDASQYVIGGDPENDFFKATEAGPNTIHYVPGLSGEQLVPPEKDLALIRGAFVNARDGHVGTVEEIVIDPASGKAAQIVVHTAGRKKQELVMPVAVIDRAEADNIYLKLSKEQVDTVPGVPVELTKEGKQRYEVLIKVFDSVEGASLAYTEWKKVWSKQARYFIHSAAILERSLEGETTFRDVADVDKRQGRVFGAVAGGLVGLVGGPVGVVVGAIAGAGAGGIAADKIDRGFSNEFLEKFVSELKPGTSALILMADRKGIPSIADSIKSLSGTVLQGELTENFINDYLQEGSSEGDNG
jgi:uncharacterized membrane protein/sporulation protein YlmC with PRC-barrel domain